MIKIAVIGSGSWGTAMSFMLGKKGHKVCLWSYFEKESVELAKNHENIPFLPGVKLPDNVTFTHDIREAVTGAELVVIATPSHTVNNISKSMAPYIADGQLLVNIGKGFDEESLSCLSQVIQRNIPQAKVAVLSGPSHAEEVGKGLPTTNVVAHLDIQVAKSIQDIFMCNNFRVYTSTDVIGVELGGALKNVVALAAGISDGLGFGDNTKAALMTRGMAEIKRLGVAMGGDNETFSGLSGIGDLIVTCTSMHSRNRRAGILIGKGKTPEQAQDEIKMVVEGIRTCKSAYKLGEKYNVEMPITEIMYKVLFEALPPFDAVNMLMNRDKREEKE